MTKNQDHNSHFSNTSYGGILFKKLPPEVQKWAESLPWNQRRYVLSLCCILCASAPETQAEFLDNYTADGLVSKMLEDIDTLHRVKEYLEEFRVQTELNETDLRSYIRQFYVHSSQDARRQPDQYLESALRFVLSVEERNHVFNYILGFELIKIMFRMSWLQHEKLARLQTNQESFISTYIKPIQYAHKVNNIIVPKDKGVFFAKRDYFVKLPEVSEKKLIELVMATFTTDLVIECGFAMTRHVRALRFDYDTVFLESEQDSPFAPEFESSYR